MLLPILMYTFTRINELKQIKLYTRLSKFYNEKLLMKNILLIIAIALSISVWGQEEGIFKVACIGNSITYGSGINNRMENSYPAQLSVMLGQDYETKNYGLSGRTLLTNADHPYMAEDMFFKAINWHPHIVIIMLGSNDSKPHNWKYKDEFESDYLKMINAFDTLSSNPEIYLMAPVPVFKDRCGISDAVVKNEIYPIVKDLTEKKNLQFIDLYYPLIKMGDMFPDGVHPNTEGSTEMAEIVYRHIIKE